MICPRCGYAPKGKSGIERLWDLVLHMEKKYKDAWSILREETKLKIEDGSH